MSQITAADVSKLRKITGAGMMDCKNALTEANGDFTKAIEIIRKKGQAVAMKRADREAREGVSLAKVSKDGKKGVMIVLNCETDFVAKNSDFVAFAHSILDLALDKLPASLDSLKSLPLGKVPVSEAIVHQIGVIGEKIDLSYYEKLEAPFVSAYIHFGNKLSALVGLNQVPNNPQVGKEVAMQVAAMNPISIDKDDVPKEMIAQEMEIGKEQARRDGKPEEMLEKIALGKLNKFYKDSTLLNQEYVKDTKITVRQFLEGVKKDLKVTRFLRYSLRD
jgi:elongation factor Ts